MFKICLFIITFISFSNFALGSFNKTTSERFFKIEKNPAEKPLHRLGEKKWNKLFYRVKNIKKKDLSSVVFLGDSITEALGYSPVWKKTFQNQRPLNLGIWSDRTQHLLWRIQNGQIDGLNPKVFVLLIGTNNILINTPLQIAGGVEKITREINERYPKSHILLFGIFPSNKSPLHKRRKLIQKTNSHISKLNLLPYITYLDIGSSFLSKDGSISKRIMTDYLHLSEKGKKIWVKKMSPVIKDFL